VQIASWKIKGLGENFPMELDQNNHRLFIGFRAPAKLVVLSSDTGREITKLDCIEGSNLNTCFRPKMFVRGGAMQFY